MTTFLRDGRSTQYINAAIEQLRSEGFPINDEDLKRLSPLGHDHINLLGRYHFSTNDLPKEGLRPLRDPTVSD